MAFNNTGNYDDQRDFAPVSIDLSKLELGATISPTLFSEVAEKLARTICSEKNTNKRAQLRRFYDELVLWHDKVFVEDPDKRGAKFNEFWPYILMMTAKAAYARGRKNAGNTLISENMYQLLRKLIGQINSPETLRQAKLFFEAFMGFTKVFEKN